MSSDLFDLKGKVAIVTGGSQGIGLAMSQALAGAGANVVIANRRADVARRAVESVKKYGTEVMAITTDVSDRNSVESMVEETVRAFGTVDILCNNAGIMYRRPVEEHTVEEWQELNDINVKGTWLCSAAAAKHMKRRKRGKIINTSSVAATIALHERAAYCASKGAVSQLTKVMAVEWAKYNINVNAIGPGLTRTPLNSEFYDSHPDILNKILEGIPLGKVAMPDDMKGITIFLASKASDFITGQTIFVDGGWTIL